ncbi:hypothetical protein JHK84_027577 [Glycine max]|nr:hypothetical protein JHK85_027980 [Glycine max]KAG5151105.1 hypothetical protein JHK84_027577 [Glycine max]
MVVTFTCKLQTLQYLYRSVSRTWSTAGGRQQAFADIDASRALFIEITEILGADTVIPDQSPSGFLFPLETPHSEGGLNDQPACTEGVCGNAA